MTARFSLVFAGIVLAMMAGCGRGGTDQQKTEAPPAAPASPAAGYEVVQVSDGGSISGSITVSGSIPKLPVRTLNKDSNVCGTAARDSEDLIVNRGGGLKNAVVIVEGVKRGKAIPAAIENSQIDQSKCEYSPHVQVARVNAEIAVLNSDPILHNIHFYQNDDSLFNIAQPVKGQVNKHKLEKVGFVYAECDVHGWMRGHVAVVDSPYYAVTDENGKFSITDLPPGNYRVKVWHEYLGEKAQDVAVAAKTDATLNLDLKDLLSKKNPAPAAITSAPSSTGTSAPAAASAPAGTPGAEVSVQMISDGSNFKFEPTNITVKVGTTVKWVNMSENRHSATDDPEFEKEIGQAILPAGVEPWSTPFVVTGESTTRRFTVPGKYQYFCRNHGQFGMVGTITVVP
jgi:plastocyanin